MSNPASVKRKINRRVDAQGNRDWVARGPGTRGCEEWFRAAGYDSDASCGRSALAGTGERIWVGGEVGYTHLVLDTDGAIVALVTGGTDADAWSRLQGELRRRNIDVD